MRTSTVLGTYYVSKLSKKRHLYSSSNDKVGHRYKAIYNNNITGYRPPAEKDIVSLRAIDKNKKNMGPRAINKNKKTGPRAIGKNKKNTDPRVIDKNKKNTDP